MPVIDTPRDPRALRTWVSASTVNVAGSLATAAALPIVVFQVTHDPAAVSVLAVLEASPYLVLGLFAGHFADQHGRQRIVVLGLLITAAVAAVQAVGLWLHPTLPTIYACALAAAVLFVITDAADFGLLPEVVRGQELPRAWGLSGAWSDVCAVVVPPGTALVVALAGAAPVLALDALSFAVAAALVASLRPRHAPTPPPLSLPAPGPASSADESWRAGWTFIRGNATVRTLVLCGFFNSAGFGLVTALLVVYAVDGLGLTPAGWHLGLILGSAAAGGVLMGLCFERVYRRAGAAPLTRLGTGGCTLVVLLLAACHEMTVAVVLLAAYGALLALTITVGIVYRQEAAPERLRSRVMTVGRMVAWGGQPAGAGLGGLLAHLAGVRAAYLLAAGLFGLAFMIATTIPRPQRSRVSSSHRPPLRQWTRIRAAGHGDGA
jgi:MFS family permease